MSDNEEKTKIGKIEWCDLTVENAEEVRDFYSSVVGWKSTNVSMGEYDDYCVNQPDDGETVAGVCHARGGNKDMPAQWMMYVRVSDVAKSAEQCKAMGGKVLVGPKPMGTSEFCVIQDPAGAVLGLISG
jgi:predicted enzyme related to lactoylglutathione lyase